MTIARPKRLVLTQCLAGAVLIFVAAALGGGARGEDAGLVAGPAQIIDASHLAVAGRTFKLYGIDAPDVDETCDDAQGKSYPCGLEAREALVALTKGQTVSCLPRGPNSIDEVLGTCSTRAVDLAGALIAKGWAIADRPRTLYYEDDELAARRAKRGVWQGAFVLPEAWRAGERVASPRQRRRFDSLR